MALRYDLYAALAALTAEVLQSTSDGAPREDRVAEWEQVNASVDRPGPQRDRRVRATPRADLAALSVLLRQIRTLVRRPPPAEQRPARHLGDCRPRLSFVRRSATGPASSLVRAVTVVACRRREPYEPMTLARLGALLVGRGRLPTMAARGGVPRGIPVGAGRDARPLCSPRRASTSGDERWDAFLAALAEHLAAKDGHAAPAWAETRSLRRFWFPFNTRAARVDAVVNAPAAFRRRGVYVAAQELERRVSADDPLSTAAPSRMPSADSATAWPDRGVVADLYVFGGAAMALAYDARLAVSQHHPSTCWR